MTLSVAFSVALLVTWPVIMLVFVLVAEFIAVAAVWVLVTETEVPRAMGFPIISAITEAIAESLPITGLAPFEALIVIPIVVAIHVVMVPVVMVHVVMVPVAMVVHVVTVVMVLRGSRGIKRPGESGGDGGKQRHAEKRS